VLPTQSRPWQFSGRLTGSLRSSTGHSLIPPPEA
jgi:hypothetical protein